MRPIFAFGLVLFLAVFSVGCSSVPVHDIDIVDGKMTYDDVGTKLNASMSEHDKYEFGFGGTGLSGMTVQNSFSGRATAYDCFRAIMPPSFNVTQEGPRRLVFSRVVVAGVRPSSPSPAERKRQAKLESLRELARIAREFEESEKAGEVEPKPAPATDSSPGKETASSAKLDELNRKLDEIKAELNALATWREQVDKDRVDLKLGFRLIRERLPADSSPAPAPETR